MAESYRRKVARTQPVRRPYRKRTNQVARTLPVRRKRANNGRRVGKNPSPGTPRRVGARYPKRNRPVKKYGIHARKVASALKLYGL